MQAVLDTAARAIETLTAPAEPARALKEVFIHAARLSRARYDRPKGADQTRMIKASPWPPPPHKAAAPTPPPRRFSSYASVKIRRAPLIPMG